MAQKKDHGGWSFFLLKSLLDFAYKGPWKVLTLAVLMFVASLVYSAAKLEFLTDRAALVDQNEKFRALSDKFNQEFPHNEELLVVVDGGTTAQRESFADEMARRLKAKPQLYSDIFVKVELPFLRHQALQYLDLGDLVKLRDSLAKAQGMVSALSDQGDVGKLLAATTNDLEEMLPVLNSILGQLVKSLQTRGRYQYESPWASAFFSAPEAGAPEEGHDFFKEATRTAFYNTINNDRIHLVLVRPAEDSGAAIENLRQLVKHLKPAYPELNIGITGELVLDQDEMESSISDSLRATVWSLVLVVLMFSLSFRSPWRPAMALFALALSLGWTLGFTTLAIGHLNLLTVTFATMLIGLGTDFGIHFIYGYEEERARGMEPYQAMLETMSHAGVENMTGAVTTAIAFWAICLTDFRGVAELGAIAGTGVLLSFLAMGSVLPAMIFLQERRRRQAPNQEPRPSWAWVLSTVENTLMAYPGYVTAFCALFTAWSLIRIPEVTFDYNLLHLQSPALQSVQTELKLVSSEGGVLFAVALADDIPQAEKLSQQFSALHSVERVESVVPLVPKDYAAKAPVLREIVALLQNIPLPNPEDAAQSGTGKGLMKMADGFMLLESTFREAYPRLIQSPDPKVRAEAIKFKHILDTLFATLQKMGAGPISDSVTAFQANLYGDLRSMLEFMKEQRADQPLSLQDLPEAIKLRSLGKTGKILIRIYPKRNPWERDYLRVFVDQIQKVDPEVIGTPVMVYYHTESLKRAFEKSGQYALGAIALILLIHFRNLKNTLLALLPKIVGVIWMLGLMAYNGVLFNPANFMALPLILGIGLIFGVHVVHRLLENPHEGIFSHSTGPAIALSACVTMAGFGTLMMAKHQGIASLGFLMTAGVGANLITSLVLLPAFMRLISPRKPAILEPGPE
jgi:hopanoid biosynthesis associated RND transporter like protein HpnN